MKIYSFNPETGRRSVQPIDARQLASYTDSYHPEYRGLAIDLNPKVVGDERGFGFDAEVTIHKDAGRLDESYQSDQWICFCLGSWRAGPEAKPFWNWVVLPPR